MTDHCTNFLGLQIVAQCDGDRVTGRVEFPEVYDRKPVPIDYRSRRPEPALSPERSRRVEGPVDPELVTNSK